MNTEYKKAIELADSGLLVKRTGYNSDLEIFCYTQDTFYNSKWCDTTLTHRGKLYYKGEPVNYPFPKIFNLDEHESTKKETVFNKMKNVSYEVLHKSNGHLLIASVFQTNDELRIVYSTKGSLPNSTNELLNKDIEILNEYGFDEKLKAIFNRCGKPFTLMFESIVEHDKHTLYNQDVERYNGKKNNFILIGWYTEEFFPKSASHESLSHLAEDYGFDVVERFNEMDSDVNSWFDHKETEGYVIHFLDDSDLRVKIKTKEYWFMRFKKDLHPTNILLTFKKAGFDRLYKKLPEEVYKQIKEIIYLYFVEWVKLSKNNLSETSKKYIDYNNEIINGTNISDFMRDDTISKLEKDFLLLIYNKTDIHETTKRYSQSKGKRNLFCEYLINNEEIFKNFSTECIDITENL